MNHYCLHHISQLEGLLWQDFSQISTKSHPKLNQLSFGSDLTPKQVALEKMNLSNSADQRFTILD